MEYFSIQFCRKTADTAQISIILDLVAKIMSTQLLVSDLPEDVIFMILGYLSYDNVAQIRIVNCFFNDICKQHLNRGFKKVEKVIDNFRKDIKSKLPRRESERNTHPYIKHSRTLCWVNAKVSELSCAFRQYNDDNLWCFIPGKIIDEVYSILNILRINQETPQAYDSDNVRQELGDMSCMAREHFTEKIEPGLLQLQKHQKKDERPSSSLTFSLLEQHEPTLTEDEVRISIAKISSHIL